MNIIFLFYFERNQLLIWRLGFYEHKTNDNLFVLQRILSSILLLLSRREEKRFNNTSAKINLICLKTRWQVLGNSTPFCRHWLGHFFLRILGEARDSFVLGHIKLQFCCIARHHHFWRCSTSPRPNPSRIVARLSLDFQNEKKIIPRTSNRVWECR